MRVPKKKKNNKQQTNIQAFANPSSPSQVSVEQSNPVKSPQTNPQNQLQQVSSYSGFAKASISSPQQNLENSSSQTEDLQSIQKKSSLINRYSGATPESNNNNNNNNDNPNQRFLPKYNVENRQSNSLQSKPARYKPSSFLPNRIQKREDDRIKPNNNYQNIYQRVGTIQRANMIQRDIDKLEFSETAGKSKKIDTLNQKVTNYNKMDTDTDDSRIMGTAVAKIREIIDYTNNWIASLQGKQSSIEEVVDVDKRTKKSSSWGMKNWFSTKKKLTKHASKKEKLATLKVWLETSVYPELETRNNQFSQSYSDDVNSENEKKKYLTSTPQDSKAAGTTFDTMKKDKRYKGMSLGKVNAIRSYTSSLHSLMNAVSQRKESRAKSFIKEKIKNDIPISIKFARLNQLVTWINSEETHILLRKYEYPNELEELQEELKPYSNKEYLDSNLNVFAHLGATSAIQEEKIENFQSAYTQIVNKLNDKDTLNAIANQIYGELKVQNTMATEGLHSLPSSKDTIYRGDWYQAVYWSGDLNFDFFASGTKDPRIAMQFFNNYRTPGQDEKDKEMGQNSGFLKYPVLVEIKLTGGGGGKDISMISRIQKEEEVLIMPGTTCKVVNREKKSLSGGGTYYYIKAVEEGGDPEEANKDNGLGLSVEDIVELDLGYIKKYLGNNTAATHPEMAQKITQENEQKQLSDQFEISSNDQKINNYIESGRVVIEDTLAPYYDLEILLHTHLADQLTDNTIVKIIKMRDIVDSLVKQTGLLAEYDSLNGVVTLIYGNYEMVKAREEEYQLVMKIAKSLVAEQEPEQNDVDQLKSLQSSRQEEIRQEEESLLQQQQEQQMLVNAKQKFRQLRNKKVTLTGSVPAYSDPDSLIIGSGQSHDLTFAKDDEITIDMYYDSSMLSGDYPPHVSVYYGFGDVYYVKAVDLLKAMA